MASKKKSVAAAPSGVKKRSQKQKKTKTAAPAPAPAPAPAVRPPPPSRAELAAAEGQKAGVSVPEGLLPAPRVLTPGQLLRRQELKTEVETKKQAERRLREEKKAIKEQLNAVCTAHQASVLSLQKSIRELKTLS
ncbi:hypothetical protein BO78DRAFT_436208 [Aspergillus sclerotiicarbonarius CBS 121057]|uniref:Uncharacterized protein n=1 Tax=Aspergillus sclerotiicarbonarius (strain CBS 121057 / IBT 28362) TaxID=1448318 RepID=A0A319DU73_ASPSB|nr:hypothetical protein BO78DRAFT_436208 [Aspergillus sclerotiicarbonarius CBS 121057]